MAHDNVSIKVQDERGEKEMVAKKVKIRSCPKTQNNGVVEQGYKRGNRASDEDINGL
jgi:hypothetical protein